jgi:hypothetical protein
MADHGAQKDDPHDLRERGHVSCETLFNRHPLDDRLSEPKLLPDDGICMSERLPGVLSLIWFGREVGLSC